MKKTIFISYVLALIVASLTLGVNAHPGKTDGSGGHTDHNTGEYHYHHGYSAHDHYDMDSDGDVDCPYDFDDKTNHSSGEGSAISPSIGDTNKLDSQENDSKSEKVSIGGVVFATLECLLLAVAIWISSSYFLSYIFMLIFGEDRGCSISMISGAVITIIASIWIISNKLS